MVTNIIAVCVSIVDVEDVQCCVRSFHQQRFGLVKCLHAAAMSFMPGCHGRAFLVMVCFIN